MLDGDAVEQQAEGEGEPIDQAQGTPHDVEGKGDDECWNGKPTECTLNKPYHLDLQSVERGNWLAPATVTRGANALEHDGAHTAHEQHDAHEKREHERKASSHTAPSSCSKDSIRGESNGPGPRESLHCKIANLSVALTELRDVVHASRVGTMLPRGS